MGYYELMAAVAYPENFRRRTPTERALDWALKKTLVWANGEGSRASFANWFVTKRSNGWNPLDHRFDSDAYRENFDRYSEDGINTSSLFGEPVIGNLEVARQVLRTGLAGPRFQQANYVDTHGELDPEVFDIIRNTLLGLDGPEHKNLRSFVSREFLESILTEIEPVLQQRADGLVDVWIENAEGRKTTFDAVTEITGPFATSTIMDLLGYPEEFAPELATLGQLALGAVDSTAGFDQQQMNQAMAAFVKRIRFIEEKATTGSTEINQNGMLARLVRDGLNGPELLSMATVMLVAGFVTTKSHMAETAAHLANNEGARISFEEAVRNGDEKTRDLYLDNALKLNPPIRLLGREVPPENPITLPDGSQYSGPVVIDILACNMDPANTEGDDISFGSGAHRCVGAPLAALETQILLSTIASKLDLHEATVSRSHLMVAPHALSAHITFTARQVPLVASNDAGTASTLNQPPVAETSDQDSRNPKLFGSGASSGPETQGPAPQPATELPHPATETAHRGPDSGTPPPTA